MKINKYIKDKHEAHLPWVKIIYKMFHLKANNFVVAFELVQATWEVTKETPGVISVVCYKLSAI